MYAAPLTGCTPDNMLPCAGEGQPLTLVCTDVEGSTELWEWDTAAMLQAVAAHDRAMRGLMVVHHGYEVWTEGDAFLVAFHGYVEALLATCVAGLSHAILGVGGWERFTTQSPSAPVASCAASTCSSAYLQA